jgi:flagellar motor switch protein FliN
MADETKYKDDFPEDEDFPEEDDFLDEHDKFFDEKEHRDEVAEGPAAPIPEEAPTPTTEEELPPNTPAEETPPPPAEENPPPEQLEDNIATDTTPRDTTSIKDLPVRLDVEVARLVMTMDKLMNIQSGNIIDLQISPNNAVDLVANGKLIGKGELIKLEDTIGVRILEIG